MTKTTPFASKYTPPQITATYFDACNVASLMRGIHISIFVLALKRINSKQEQQLLPASRTIAHSKRIMNLLVIALFLLSTTDLVTFWAYVRRGLISHGQTVNDAAAALNQDPIWFTGRMAFPDANSILADSIMIWRCRFVWNNSWRVIIFPLVTVLLTIAFSVVAVYRATISDAPFGVRRVDFATAYYTASLFTTVYCTSAIVFRITKIRTNASIGHAVQMYKRAFEVLIESATLYSIATLFALVSYVYNGPASEIAYALWVSITGIAPTLLIARASQSDGFRYEQKSPLEIASFTLP